MAGQYINKIEFFGGRGDRGLPCVVLFPLLCSTNHLLQWSSRLQGSLLENYDVDKIIKRNPK
ncbi:hypothetical protein HPP92_021286 [Vanilla planifolia]|uniref:Uncharacterized protein n=1 Tax=Vanilla planifolia TaxID=51239 RepID=A0A835UFD7_VANPL|nr:hypothetical protein HPP92_021286 [Vanilla planifolia]